MHTYAVSVSGTVISHPLWRESFKRSKFRRIEFGIQALPAEERRGPLRLVREMTEAGELEVASLHLPWPWNYASCDESVRVEALRNVRELLDFYRELHVRNYTLHGSQEPIAPENRAGTIQSIRRTLSDLLPFFQEEGASVNVELLPRSCIGRVPEELEAITEGFPEENVGICFDVNHINMHPEWIPSYIERLAPRLRTFHLSDYDGVDECHWYPGLGVIDWAAVMEKICALPHDVTLIFECFGSLGASAWQKRQISPAVPLRNLANSACFLEHAAERRAGEELFTLP